MFRAFPTISVVLLGLQLGFAQLPIINSCPADAPITITPSSVSGSTQTITIENKGSQPITAVITSWQVTDSNGKFYPGTNVVDFAPSGGLLQPGQSVQTQGDLTVERGSTLKTVEINCKAVLYSGTHGWGDLKSVEVMRVRAERRGIEAERRRLLNVYQTEGNAKLIDELKRPVEK